MSIYKPPSNISERDRTKKSIFLAGTIDMGKSENWQETVENFFNDLGWNIFNPRRIDWDSTWTQEFQNPNFYQQVNWELRSLEQSDCILIYFAPKSLSPISLLELGLFAKSNKIKVVCPDGFYRKGNVEVICDYFNIPIFNDLDTALKSYLNE